MCENIIDTNKSLKTFTSLSPCPNCDRGQITVEQQDDVFYVTCRVCGYRVQGTTWREAVSLWNQKYKERVKK